MSDIVALPVDLVVVRVSRVEATTQTVIRQGGKQDIERGMMLTLDVRGAEVGSEIAQLQFLVVLPAMKELIFMTTHALYVLATTDPLSAKELEDAIERKKAAEAAKAGGGSDGPGGGHGPH